MRLSYIYNANLYTCKTVYVPRDLDRTRLVTANYWWGFRHSQTQAWSKHHGVHQNKLNCTNQLCMTSVGMQAYKRYNWERYR